MPQNYIQEHQRLLERLDEVERNRCYEILTFIITQNFQEIPGYLTEAENQVVTKLLNFHRKNELKSLDEYGFLRNAAKEARNSGFFSRPSKLESNLTLRLDILHYVIERTGRELNEAKEQLVQPVDNQLHNQHELFKACWTNLHNALNDQKGYCKKIERVKRKGKFIELGILAGAFACGFAFSALYIPALGLGAAAGIGVAYGILLGALSVFPVELFGKVAYTIVKDRKTRKLGERISQRTSRFLVNIENNPGEVDEKAVKLSEAITSKQLGFFSNRNWQRNREESALEIPNIEYRPLVI